MKGIEKYEDQKDKWARILEDKEFAATLSSRSNVDLKDKYRNLMKKTFNPLKAETLL